MPAYADVSSNRQSSPTTNGVNGTGGDLPENIKYAKYQGDICITGMAGRIGQANDLMEFKDMIWNKRDGYTTKNMRFDCDKYGTQKRHAYIEGAELFDSDYFGIAPKNAEFLDPNIRLSMEAAFEATVDAGYSLPEFRGTNTGVYVSCGTYDANCYWLSKALDTLGEAKQGIGVVNNFRASRISYAMDLRGPSMCVDTACSGYLSAVETAMKDIRLGIVDAAFVVSCQLHCNPISSQLFLEIGAAGPNGKCFSFDERAEGFGRGESLGAMLLQKEEDARRIYCKLAHCYQSCDGNSGDFDFNHPSVFGQMQTITQCYDQCGIDPQTVEYVECHGTGTPAGDSVETNAICNVFCGKRRSGHLMVGSVKTNVGHAENAAGFNAMAKCIFSIREGMIPPNLNFEFPNPKIPGLLDGRLKVPTELTPWRGEMCGISGFGIGGTNAHCVLKKNDRPNSVVHPAYDAVRLFTYGARTEEGLRGILNEVQKNASNVGYQALLQPSANEPVQKMPFRGFTILNSKENMTEVKQAKRRPIVYVCTGMGCQWTGMGKGMMKIPAFKESIQKSCEILKRNHNVDLYEHILNGTNDQVEPGIGLGVCIPVIQVALIDLLNAMGVEPDYIFGHSLGEVAAGYADGCLSREEAMLVPVCRIRAATSTKETQGKMAAIGLSLEELEKILPSELDIACHNAEDSVTVSGAASAVEAFVKQLESKNIFAKEVDSLGTSFHSRRIRKAEGEYRRLLGNKLSGKARSLRWLSSCYPREEWDTEDCKHGGVEYYTYNYCNRVRFYGVAKDLPKDSLVIEIAPHGLLQSLLKRTFGTNCAYASLMKRGHPDNAMHCFENLGNMYTNGCTLKPLNIFPEVSFPVADSTPLISPIITKQWSHPHIFRVPHIDDITDTASDAFEVTFDFTENGNARYIFGHQLNGVKLFPGTGYLFIVWEALAAQHGSSFDKLPVILENVSIVRATMLPEDGKLTFTCRLLRTGEFEVTENDELVANGKICLASEATKIKNEMKELDDKIKSQRNEKKPSILQTRDEIYLTLLHRGLDYAGPFRGIASTDRQVVEIEHKGEWIAFLDCFLQAAVYLLKADSHLAPSKFDAVYLDAAHIQEQKMTGVELPTAHLRYDQDMDYGTSEVFKFIGFSLVDTQPAPSGDPLLEEIRYVPYLANIPEAVDASLRQYATDCLQYTVRGLEDALKGGNFPLLTQNKEIVADALKEFNFKSETSSDKDLSKACQLPNSGLAKTLKKIFPPHGVNTDPRTVGETLITSKKELSQDRLMDSLSSTAVLNAALEIVKFNFPDGKHTVVEVDAGSSRMYRHIIPRLTIRAGINYTATDKFGLPKDFKGAGLKPITWDPASGSPPPNVQANLLVLKNVLHKQADVVPAIKKLTNCVMPGGFILVQEVTHNFPLFVAMEGLHQDIKLPTTNGTREYGRFMTDSTWQSYFAKQDLDLVYRKSDGLLSTLYLLRKRQEIPIEPTFLHMEGLDCSKWLDEIQGEMAKLEAEPTNSGKRLWILSETANSGVFGFVQCLRKEPGGDKVRFALSSNLDDTTDKADMATEKLKKKVVDLDLYQNVYRDGQWGFFARKPLDMSFKNVARLSDGYVTVPVIGDPSSARWISSRQEALATDDFMERDSDKFCSVYYSGVNDRDVLLSHGKIPRTADLQWRFNHGLYGFEFVGRRSNGSRVIGLVPGLALATGLNYSRGVVVDIPESWTMKDAASVPYAYLSVYYALVIRHPVREGQRVLVHAGATAVGTAAIRTALNVGAEVFTTVESEEERRYVRKTIPKLPEYHIIFRRQELSITDGIEALTNGEGVDVVLSPYADDDLFEESVSSMRTSGQYVEMGRTNSSKVVEEFAAKLLQKNMMYTRVDTVVIINDKASHPSLAKRVSEDMQVGLIKPITAAVYEADQIGEAFQAASESRVIGKIVVQIREEESYGGFLTQPISLSVSPRVTCDPRKVYILCGGLGGFGLELTHWLVQRGARNIVLTSRRGITNGYQEHKVKILKENYKANIAVVATTLKSPADAGVLLKQAQHMGPIGGIFVLSLVLRDRFLSQLTKETFAEAANSKINDTIFMDEASRQLCGPELDWFVPFSSIASGWGNAAQTNYGFGNSVMERTCEKRKADGLPGMAIQWGAVGDVGAFMVKTGFEREGQAMVATFEAMGLGIQKIDSCLHAMDTLLLLKDQDVVASHQPAGFEKPTDGGSGGGAKSLLAATSKVFGMNSMENLTDDVTLGSLGLDSLMGVEMKQLLEKDFDVLVTLVEVRKMTMAKLREIEAANKEE